MTRLYKNSLFYSSTFYNFIFIFTRQALFSQLSHRASSFLYLNLFSTLDLCLMYREKWSSAFIILPLIPVEIIEYFPYAFGMLPLSYSFALGFISGLSTLFHWPAYFSTVLFTGVVYNAYKKNLVALKQ